MTLNLTTPYAGAEAGMLAKFLAGGGFDPLSTYRSTVLGQNTNPTTSTGSTSTYSTGGTTSSSSNWQEQLIQTLISKGYNTTDAKNAAYGPRASDLAKEYGVGTGSTGSGNPLQDVNDLIQNSFKTLTDQASQKFGEYQSSHPFSLDQVLADSLKQAKEQVDPYYNETLNNYLTGVTRRITRSKEDTQNLLGELNAQTASYSRDTQIKLNQALENSNQGFADSGLLSSGSAMRASGGIAVNTGNSLADYLRGQQYRTNQATLQNERTLQDVNLESTQQQRDIGREQFTAEQTRANQLAQEAGQTYVRGFQQTLPPQLQANTGFDLLKQLGIPG